MRLLTHPSQQLAMSNASSWQRMMLLAVRSNMEPHDCCREAEAADANGVQKASKTVTGRRGRHPAPCQCVHSFLQAG